jgi:hypothetical protein
MRFAFAPAALLCSLSLSAADEAMLRLLPPDVPTVAGADFDRLKNSSLGSLIFRVFDKENADLAKFIAATGFDPRRDIREVIGAEDRQAARSGRNPLGDLVIVRGTFDEARILGSASVFGGIVNTYQGVRVLTPPRESSVEIAFLGNLAVAGKPAAVRAAIDRHMAKASLAGAAARAESRSRQYHAWAITGSLDQFTYRPPNAHSPGAAAKNALTAVESVTAGVLFGDQIQVSAEALARNAQDATAIVDLYRLAAMMLQSQSKQSTNERAEAFRRMLESVNATVDGRTARFSAVVPSEFVEKWFFRAPRPAAKPAAHSVQPASAR